MRLAYHNHDFEFKDWGDGKTGFSIFQKETDPALVNFEVDIYWITKSRIGIRLNSSKANSARLKMWHVRYGHTPEKSLRKWDGLINY